MKPRRIFLLGSTGSIGQNTLRCLTHLARLGRPFRVVGLAAGRGGREFEAQIRAWRPEVVYVRDEAARAKLRSRFPRLRLFSGGEAGLVEAVEAVPYDLTINALVGSAGLAPTMAALARGADLALANKETLIMAGELVTREVRRRGVKLLPIDSEHSALFQLLRGIRRDEVHRLVLTASGGPFYFKRIKNPTREQALAHPTWKMGPKISIDSATLMNKGFEVAEAHYLFGVDFDRIDTVVHPQSIIHSLVETRDGEYYAQLGKNDMRLPIQNALTYPDVLSGPVPRLKKLWELPALNFFPPDLRRFPLLALAYACGRRGGTALAALNAANEAAVGLFLNGKVQFNRIAQLVEREVARHPWRRHPDLRYVLALDREIKARLAVGGESR